MCLTNDKSILFSGSNDKTVIAWHTSKFEYLFMMKFDHPIFTLKLTTRNNYLVALDKKQAPYKLTHKGKVDWKPEEIVTQ